MEQGPSQPKFEGRIDSWKGIAAFLDRDERTVQRWEKERGIPVHRVPGKRGAVFAYPNELLAWLHQPGSGLPFDIAQATPTPSAVAFPDAPVQGGAASQRAKRTGRYTFGGVAAVVIIATIGVLGWHRLHVQSIALSANPTRLSLSSYHPSQRARELYLDGSFYWNRRDRESLDKALAAFQHAAQVDPNYGEAYIGIAETYGLMPEFGNTPTRVAYPLALAAAQRAVRLLPESADAHRVRAFVEFYWAWHSEVAFAEFRRSIELDPRNPETHHWYANALFTLRQIAPAEAEIRQARDLDPKSRSILADRLLIESYDASKRATSLLKLTEFEVAEPGFLSPPRYLADAYIKNRNYIGYLDQTTKIAAITHSPEDIALAIAVANGWRTGGEHGMWTALRAMQQSEFQRGDSSGFALGMTCMRLGDTSDGIKFLKAAYDSRDFQLLTLLNGGDDPLVVSLQKESAYQDIRNGMEQQLKATS